MLEENLPLSNCKSSKLMQNEYIMDMHDNKARLLRSSANVNKLYDVAKSLDNEDIEVR